MARANDRAPNFIYSDDEGNTWNFGGQLTTNSSSSYNKGYYKYWGNGVDRIDMVFTEQHPRDHTTSIYHGYIQNKKAYNTEGKEADDDIYDRKYIPTFDKFTKVFAHGTVVNGITMGRCWQSDIMRYDDGTIAILFKARANNSETDHRNFYARYDKDKKWKITYIGKAGTKMYDSEQDYTGLGALCPDDPNRIYISSPFNPGDDNSKAGNGKSGEALLPIMARRGNGKQSLQIQQKTTSGQWFQNGKRGKKRCCGSEELTTQHRFSVPELWVLFTSMKSWIQRKNQCRVCSLGLVFLFLHLMKSIPLMEGLLRRETLR
jgi:hypothetical protein